MAVGVVHPVAAAARGRHARPAPARRPRSPSRRCSSSTRSRRCWRRCNERIAQRGGSPRGAALAALAATAAPARQRSGAGATAAGRDAVLVLVGLVLAVATSTTSCARPASTTASSPTWRRGATTPATTTTTSRSTRKRSAPAAARGAVRQHQRRARPKASTQICLAIWGPVGGRPAHGPRRLVSAARTSKTTCASERYGCFGAGGQGLCPR